MLVRKMPLITFPSRLSQKFGDFHNIAYLCSVNVLNKVLSCIKPAISPTPESMWLMP